MKNTNIKNKNLIRNSIITSLILTMVLILSSVSYAGISAANNIKVNQSGFGTGWVLSVLLLILGLFCVLVYKKAQITNSSGHRQTSFTIGARILGGYGAILILLSVIFMVTFVNVSSIGEQIYSIAEIDIKAIETISSVETNQLEQMIHLERAIRYSEKDGEKAKEQYQNSVNEFRELAENVDQKIEEGIKQLSEVKVHNSEDEKEIRGIVEHLEVIDREHQDFDNHAEEVFTFIDAGNHSAALVLEDKLAEEGDQLDKELEEFLFIVEKRTDEAVKQAESDEAFAINLITILSLIAIALGMFLGWMNTNSVIGPINSIGEVARGVAMGNLQNEVNIERNDEIGSLADYFRIMIETLKAKANVAGQIAAGNLDVEVKALSKEDVLGQAMIDMRQNLKEGQEKVAAALNDAEQKVAYLNNVLFPIHVVDKDMTVQYMNTAAAKICGLSTKACIGQKCFKLLTNHHCNTDKCVTAKAMRENKIFTAETVVTKNGQNIPIQHTGTPVKDNNGNIIGAMEQTVDMTNVKNIVIEINHIAALLNEGKLDKRAKVANAEGDYKKLINGFNSAIDNIMEPVEEAQGCLAKMAHGDLTVNMKGDYKGDHAKMKDAMNNTLYALNDLLEQVTVASEQVSSGAVQVSDSSQSISQGSTEAASSLEETMASISEIIQQSHENAKNSETANGLAVSSRKSAETGNERMDKMVAAMGDINESSNEISKIIKVIDGIAFQTNLLALNAAVEAARAGVHGKGFAVVAEEVRNLAQRSAKAAKETTELIEGSVNKVQTGTKIANQTAEALTEIIDGITKVSILVEEIATASNEQVTAIDQTSSALAQIDQVTQSQSSAAEEGAATAEELSSQSIQLKQKLNKFQLSKQGGGKIGSLLQGAGISHVVETKENLPKKVKSKNGSEEATGELQMELDAEEFGQF